MARHSRGRSPRRKTDWIGWPDAGMTAITGNTKTIMGSFGFIEPTTIVRFRGIITVGVQNTADDKAILGAYGVAIVTDLALAAGAASIPGPWTDNDWDGWFVLQPFNLALEFTTDVGWDKIQSEYVIDSKAMRKAVDGDSLVTIVETQSGACTFNESVRFLSMLP